MQTVLIESSKKSLNTPKKYFLAWLWLALPVIVSKNVWAQDKHNGDYKASDQRILALPFDHTASLPGALAVSADGRIAAHIGLKGDVLIWDASLFKSLEIIPSGGKQATAVSLNADGSVLAIGYIDARLILWSRLEKKVVREFFGHSGRITALSFSSDGQTLASGADDATTQLWNVASGRRLHVFDSASNFDISTEGGIPVAIGFSGDGQALVVNEWHNNAYDVSRGSTIWSLRDELEISVRDVAPPNTDSTMRAGQAIGGKGWLLVLTGTDGLMVQGLDSCAPPHQFSKGAYADKVASDPLGRWVAFAENNKLSFFCIDGDKRGRSITLPSSMIALVPHPDGRSLFALMNVSMQSNGNNQMTVGSNAESVSGSALYRISVPEQLWKLPQLLVKQDGTHCAPTDAARRQQDFKLPEKVLELSTIAKLAPTKEMTAIPNKQSDGADGVNSVRELYFGQDDKLYALYLAESDLNSGAAVWDLRTSRFVRGHFMQHIPSNIIRLRQGWGSADNELTDLLTGNRLSTASNDDDKDHYLMMTSDPDTGQFFRLKDTYIERYSADGRRMKDIKTGGNVVGYTTRKGNLVVLYQDGHVRNWQLQASGKAKTCKLLNVEETQSAGELALSADGRFLRIVFANGSGDGPDQYAVYDLTTAKVIGNGHLLAPFPRHANRGVLADIRPNHLAIFDYDKAEIIARLPRQRSRDKSGAIQALRAAMSDDGRLVASVSVDGLIRVWDLDTHQLLGEARTGTEVTALVFDATGQRLAAGRVDAQIVVLQIPAVK